MAEIVRMPKLSDTMTDGVVAEWHKKVGDEVKSGELLAEIETDKATMEFESFQDGVLLHIGVEKGDSAPVDSILAILGEKGEDISGLLEGNGKSEPKKDDKKDDTQEEKKPKSEKEEKDSEGDESGKDSDKSDKKDKPSESETEKSDNDNEDKASAGNHQRSTSDGRIIASPLAKRLASEK